MGHYRVTIVGLGGHGCQRERGDGEAVFGCERHGCPDCIAREYVRRLKRAGETVVTAAIEHWPPDLGYPEAGVVTDDLLSGVRKGHFAEREARLRALTTERSVEVRPGSNLPATEVTVKIVGGDHARLVMEFALGRVGDATQGPYDLVVDGHAWRLCGFNQPSAFPLAMEARHLPAKLMLVPSRDAGGSLD